jgi:TRAP-type uncharacterized transport system substrate-binding protein
MNWLLLAAALLALAPSALAAGRAKLITGPERGVQPQIGRDIAKFVGRAADLDIEVVPAAGPPETLQRLREEPGIRLALLQSDAAQAYLDAAARGNPEAGQLLAPLRVIAPLYDEELYFVARSDSAFSTVHDIRDARINVGPLKSGSALSATTLYRLLFDAPLADDKASFLGHEDALVKLITDQTIDVVVLVSHQPARLLAAMKPEARRFVKLLRFDASQPGSAAALRIYGASTVRATSYPNLLSEDVPSLATRIYLVGYAARRGESEAQLARVARAWCQNFARLKAEGPALWRDMELAPPELRPGWHFAKAAARELALCAGGTPAALPADTCSQQERVLGLCEPQQ